MKKSQFTKALKIAKKIIPVAGHVEIRLIRTDDNSFFAKIDIDVDKHVIDYNMNVIEADIARKKLDDLGQLVYLIGLTVHELCHTRTQDIIKDKIGNELASELAELVFQNTLKNISSIEV